MFIYEQELPVKEQEMIESLIKRREQEIEEYEEVSFTVGERGKEVIYFVFKENNDYRIDKKANNICVKYAD